MISEELARRVLRFVLYAMFVTLLPSFSYAQETSGVASSVTKPLSAEQQTAAQKADSSTTAPVFVPSEVEGVGGRWFVPEDAKGEMAVRPSVSASKKVEDSPEASAPSSTVTSKDEKNALTQPSRIEQDQETEVAARRTPSPRQEQMNEEETEKAERDVSEDQQEEKVPPRPKWVTVYGKVESVKTLPKNELELTLKTRDLGRVKVVVSPLEIQRVPGKGRQARFRGVVIREGKQGLTIRAMEVDPKDEGAYVPCPVPAPIAVSFGFVGRL